MADTVAVMNKGRIEQLGAPEDLYELPHTTFVANFLGQSNLFTGPVLEASPDAIAVDVTGTRVLVPKARARRHSGEVTIGIRPEKLRLLPEAPAPAAGVNTLGPGRVTDVSFSGVSTQYLVTIPGADTITVFAQNLDFGPVVTPGTEVWVSWKVDHGFGLEDSTVETAKFAPELDTATIAVRAKRDLAAELEVD